MNDALTEEGKKLFPLLGKFKGFYLAGGTSLALQINHRTSVDFDFFCADAIPENLLKEVEKTFAGYEVKISVNNSEELTVFVDAVKITFLRYSFPIYSQYFEMEGVNPVREGGSNGVKLIPPKQIGFTKAYSIGRRGLYKDYVDLYYLLKGSYISLEEIVQGGEKIFGDGFNDRLFLEQLVYMKDIDEIGINFLKAKVSKKDLESYFEIEVGRFGKKI